MSSYTLNLPLHDEADLFAEIDDLEEMPFGIFSPLPPQLKFSEESLLRQVCLRPADKSDYLFP